MTSEIAERLMTVDEFMQLPDLPGGRQMELVRGKVIELPPPGGRHGFISRRIDRALGNFGEMHVLGESCGETMFLIASNPDIVRAADAAFLAFEDFPSDGIGRGAIKAAPTLAVEVLSDGVLDHEITEMIEDYLAAGTKRVWVVRIPQRTIVVHRPNGDAHTYREGDALSSDDAAFTVDGFALPVTTVFA